MWGQSEDIDPDNCLLESENDDTIIVRLREHPEGIILFEGNMCGYGRRSTLTKQGKIKHEVGQFHSWTGKKIKK